MKRNLGSLLSGLLILSIGLVLLTNNLGITRISVWPLLLTYWPVFIMIAGLGLLLNHGSKGEVLSGVLILLLGTALLLRNLGYLNFDPTILFRLFWPAVLILIGVVLLTGRSSQGTSNMAFMGALERTTSPWELKDTSYVAFMGGIELDFTLAQIPEGTTVIDLISVMGGIEIKVPKELDVECDGLAVLGGVEMLGKSTGGIIASATAHQTPILATTKKLVFHGKAIMGGIEIKASS